jgi:hypothetical protein
MTDHRILNNICKFCDDNDPRRCHYEGYSDAVDAPFRGHMAQCEYFMRSSSLPSLSLWGMRLTALQILVVRPTAVFFFPLPVDLFNHLVRLEFYAALEWEIAH